MCHFDNLPTYGTGQYDLTIHDVMIIGPDRSHTHRSAPQFQKTICDHGSHASQKTLIHRNI